MGRGRRRIVAAACVGAAVTAGSAPGTAALAGPTGPTLGGGAGLFEVGDASVPPAGAWSVTLSGTTYRIEERREPGSNGNRDALAGGLQLSRGFAGRVEAFARLDGAVLANDAGTFASYRDGTAGARVTLPLRAGGLRAAVEGTVNLPWGNRARGFSSGEIDPAGRLLLAIPLPEPDHDSSTSLLLQLGYRRRGDDRGRGYEGKPLYYLDPVHPASDGDLLELRAAVHFRAECIALFAELLLDRIRNPDLSAGEGPIFLTPGFRLAVGRHWAVLLASKIALAVDDPATDRYRPPEELFPDWQIGVALTWSAGDAPDPGAAHRGDAYPGEED